MEQKLGRTPVVILTIGSAIAAYFLRLQQLQTAYDAGGRVIAGAGKGFLTWFSLAVAVLFALYAFCLRPRKKYNTISDRSPVVLVLTLAAAVLVTMGCVCMALELEQRMDLLLAAGGVITALCWVVVGLDRYRGRRVPALLFMVPALFFALRLISDFRDWSRDPQILDYCFELLSQIGVMCATFHLGGFCFDKGRRRITVFFCLFGLYFSAAALAGGTLRDLTFTGGVLLWLLANVSPLLRPSKKRRGEAEEQNADA